MALLRSTSALATVVTLSSPRNKTLKAFAYTNSPIFTNRNRVNGSRNFSITPLRVAAPPTIEPEQSISETEKDETEDEFGEESSSSKFSWRDHWYPVSLIEDLDPRLPTPFQLLGREIVLWYDKSKSEWVAFDDKCPHRLAPLSVMFSLLVLL